MISIYNFFGKSSEISRKFLVNFSQNFQVAGARWVPISLFLDNNNDVIIRNHVTPNRFLPPWFTRGLRMENIIFPSVMLPRQLEDTLPGDELLEFMLWGLTFDMTCELLRRVSRIFASL